MLKNLKQFAKKIIFRLPFRYQKFFYLAWDKIKNPPKLSFKISTVHLELSEDAKKLKLIGFLKVYNEAKNGNLERVLKHLKTFCNEIVVCDCQSTDNSLEIIKKYTNYILIELNDFKNELFTKQKMLDYALKLNPDWIVWLDADEVFDREGEQGGIRKLCDYGNKYNIDGFSFLEINLWKSNKFYRVDEFWGKVTKVNLWRNNGDLKFDMKKGLHHQQHPLGLKKIKPVNIKLIHFGFSSPELIESKYKMYKNLGQSGFALERFIDESGLRIRPFRKEWFPPSTLETQLNSRGQLLKFDYDIRGEEKKMAGDYPRVSIVNCVSEALEMLKFSSEQLITNAGTDNFDYIIVCWNTTPQVDRYIEQLGEKFKKSHPRFRAIRVDHETIKDIGYVPNLRAMINVGFNKAFELNEYGGLVNTDQAFYKDWLVNLIKYCNPKRMVTSTLIEAGRTRHYQADFGLTEYGSFNLEGFNSLCRKIIQPGKLITASEREGIWGDPGYKNILSLPYIFHRDMWEKAGPWELTLTNGTPDVNFFDRAHTCGFEFVMSGDSIAYHVGGVERGATGKSVPVFAKDMPYDPIPLLRKIASRLKRESAHIVFRVKFFLRGKAYRKKLINKVLIREGTVLDIGCGGLKNTAFEEFLVSQEFTKITGIDIHQPSVDERRAWYQSDNRYNFICKDIRDMDLSNKYDLVTMFHVIEHLTEKEATGVLQYVKTMADEQVLVETPDQFENGLAVAQAENNQYQEHKCLITQSFMEQYGFIKIGSYVQTSGFTNSIYLYERK